MGDIHVVYHLLIKVDCFFYNYMSCTLKLMPFRSYVRSTPRTKENRGTYGIAIFPILRDDSRFFTFAATNRDYPDNSRFLKFSATNRTFSFKSGDQIRVFSFKSAGQMSRSLL